MNQLDHNHQTFTHQPREKKWDFLRGIAIFLVLLGHSIQWMDPDWQHNPLFEGIYSFHMPLFMFISGYFLKQNLQEIAFWKWQKQKVRQLFLPSVTNSVLFSLLIYYTISQGWSDLKPIWYHEALWYLNTLFAFVFVARIIAFCRSTSIRMLLWITFYTCIFFLKFYPVGMYLKFMLPFFLLGLIYRKLTTRYSLIRYCLLIPGSILIYHAFPMWDFSHSIYMLPYAPLDLANIKSFLILYANGFAGICITMLLLELIYPLIVRFKTLAPLIKITSWVGTITLPIYVVQTHFFVIREVIGGFSQSYLLQCATAIALIPLCWGIYRIVCLSPTLQLIFFGEIRTQKSQNRQGKTPSKSRTPSYNSAKH